MARLFSGLPPEKIRTGGLALVLAALVFIIFTPVFRNGFINYDDDLYIYENPQVVRGLTPATALWALTSTEQANWYPLRRLSHLVDVSLFGLDAPRHHLVSVAWHAAAAVALFLALRVMTGRTWRSFTVAGLFAAHPIQVESVAWAAERSNVLAGFFFALTLLFWAHYARRPGPARYLAALLSCALGLASKPVLVTLPLLLLLLDHWPLGRASGPGLPPTNAVKSRLGLLLAEKLPLLLLAAGAAAMAIAAHRQTESLSTLETLPLAARLANAMLSYWRYLGKLIWPADLAVFYPLTTRGAPAGDATVAGLLLAALTVTVLLLSRRRPWLGTGWLWYLGTLVPMIGLVQFGSHAMADRFAYLPSVGFFVALVWEAGERASRLRHAPVLLALCAAASLTALSATTIAYTRLWRDSLTLFRHARAVSGGHWLIETKIALALRRLGRTEEAVEHLRAALRLEPGLAQNSQNLGIALHDLGRNEEALTLLLDAVRLDPRAADVRYNLGVVLHDIGQFRAAEVQYREAVRLKPGLPKAHNNLGIVLHETGRYREAEGAYERALRLDQDFPDAHYNLGNTLSAGQRYEEAAAHYREALRLRPDDADIHSNLGFALWRLGRLDEAAARYQQVLRLRPGDGQARRNLEALLATPGVRPRTPIRPGN